MLGYLNSKISHRWIRENCPELQGGTRELSKVFFENIPVPKISESDQEPFVQLVDQILLAKEKDQDSTIFEKQIDNLVYKLYHLTDEEIEFIEKASK